MTIVVPDLGEVELLNVLLKRPNYPSVPWHIHLFANDYTPHRESVLADFTEPTFSGYDVPELDRAGWSWASAVGGVAVSFWTPAPVEWLAASGPGETVYGFFVTDQDDAVVLWAGRFDAPVAVTTTTPARVWPFMRGRSMSEPAP